MKTCPEDFRGFVSIPAGDGATIDMVDFERIHGAGALDDMLALEGMTLRRDAKPGEPVLGFTSPEAEAEFQRQVLAACNEIGLFDNDGGTRQ